MINENEETYTEEEAKEIADHGERVENFLVFMVNDKKIKPDIAFEAGLLGVALFSTGFEDMSDDAIVDAFKESLVQAREMVAEDEEGEEDGDEEA